MVGTNLELVDNSKQPSVYLNTFPQNGKSYVILSWFEDEREYLTDIIEQFQKLKQKEK